MEQPTTIEPPKAQNWVEELYALNPDLERDIRVALEAGEGERVLAMVQPLSGADVADLLERVGTDERRRLVDLLGPTLDPEVLPELDETIRDEVLSRLGPDDLAAAVRELESDDAVAVVSDLDEQQLRELFARLSAPERLVIEQGLAYDAESAGRLMQRDLVAIPPFWTVGDAIDFMRGSPALPDDFYDIFVVDPRHRPIGTVSLSRILRSRRPVRIDEIMDAEFTTIPVSANQEAAAFIFRQNDLVSAPVVDADGRLVGVITIDDVVDVIDEEHEDDIMKLGGVRERDLHEPALQTTRARFKWLLLNLGATGLAATVISLFEATIQQVVALAVLMPIVASMGGNTGTQALTVTVRALAMREVTATNTLRIVGKETLVGGINGIVFALIAGVLAGLWFASPLLGGIIGAAMVVNLIVAGFCGVTIPLLLDRFGIDPAIASTVLLTTVTDMVGFFAFLGLAWLVLI